MSTNRSSVGREVLPEEQDILLAILVELDRAREKHPLFGKDIVHRCAIVCEEAGELVRAGINNYYEGGGIEEVRKEAVQTAATALRLLILLDLENNEKPNTPTR